jgi:DNA polymerase III subunit chi
MTRVEFFFNVNDKLAKAAELTEKAVSRGRQLLILVPDEASAAALDHKLWVDSPLGFLPHCRSSHPMAAQTPVLIDYAPVAMPHHDVLINLQPAQPNFFSRFTRLIEIVGLDEQDKVQARARYRFYRDRGYELRSFDVSGAAL